MLLTSCGGVPSHDAAAARSSQDVAAPPRSRDGPKPSPAQSTLEGTAAAHPKPEGSPTAAEARDCPSGYKRRFASFSDGDRLFSGVKEGWTAVAVLRRLGDPESCSGGVWYYSAGSPDGPLVTYAFTMKDGKVASIERGGASCIYRERAE